MKIKKNKNKKKTQNNKLHYNVFTIIFSLFLLAGCYFSEDIKQNSIVEPIIIATTSPVIQIETPKVLSEVIREVTAYNVGDPFQTDDTPCIGAYGNIDLCEMIANGENICASNAFKRGTILKLESLVSDWEMECVVLDRMNRRYTNRVDIAMSLEEKQRALNFGTQTLLVKEINK